MKIFFVLWWKYYILSFAVILIVETTISLFLPSTLPFTFLEILFAFLAWYFLSPVLLTIAFRGTKSNDENLLRYVSYASALLNFRKGVHVYEVNEKFLNAMAFGNIIYRAIAVTTPLKETLNERELVAVLSHEIAHLKNMDTEIQWIYILLINLVYVYLSYETSLIYSGIVLLFGVLLMFPLHRYLEKRADITASYTTNWIAKYLGDALVKIGYLSTQLPTYIIKEIPEFQIFYIKQSLIYSNRNGDNSFFKTHPPLNERLKYLNEIDTKLNFTQYT
ncbi:MAG: M56 family metallopeptidase [Sulfolobaceae archaeon]|nr:M56 family metallopeptidase [Sulfolobaceae archaeon]